MVRGCSVRVREYMDLEDCGKEVLYGDWCGHHYYEKLNQAEEKVMQLSKELAEAREQVRVIQDMRTEWLVKHGKSRTELAKEAGVLLKENEKQTP